MPTQAQHDPDLAASGSSWDRKHVDIVKGILHFLNFAALLVIILVREALIRQISSKKCSDLI